MATIYDVAAQAGVSPKTVSRVLNGDAPVGGKTRQAVEAAMTSLGYIPSNAAQMMRGQKSGLIGLITGAISLTTEPTKPAGLPDLFIVQGIQSAFADTGKTLMIADTGGRSDRVPHLIQTFLRHRVEGLIYVAEYHQAVTLPRVPKDVHLVLANCYDDAGTPAILPDDVRGQRELVARLIASGHHRIAYLSLRPEIEAGRLRTIGYCQALQAAGIAVDPALIAPCDLGGEDGETQLLYDTIDRLLLLADPPSVLSCGNDKMALKVYGILRSRGIKVPDEMSVAGYDNYRVIAETLYPPLTTVDLPYAAMGVRAAHLLMALIRGNSPDTAPNDPLNGANTSAATLVAGPVCWRNSVTERRAATVLHFRSIREERP